MTPTDELPPFETRLLADLTEVVEDRRRTTTDAAGSPDVLAIETRRPLRTRLAVATSGVAAAGLAITLAPGLIGDGGDPAFAVRELEGGVIEVRWDEDLDDGRALEATLREHGVDVAVRTLAASPSAVGRVYGLEAPEGGTEPGFAWGPDGGDHVFRIDPEVFRGDLTLELAVAAPEGESYVVAEEVFEPGEVLGGLHCAIGEPIRADELVPYLDDLGLDVVWETIGPDAGRDPEVASSERVDAVPDGQVMWGYAVDDGTVRFEVQLDDAPLDPELWSSRLSDVPCTPDQAAAWG